MFEHNFESPVFGSSSSRDRHSGVSDCFFVDAAHGPTLIGGNTAHCVPIAGSQKNVELKGVSQQDQIWPSAMTATNSVKHPNFVQCIKTNQVTSKDQNKQEVPVWPPLDRRRIPLFMGQGLQEGRDYWPHLP
jgi:hypothetical protein